MRNVSSLEPLSLTFCMFQVLAFATLVTASCSHLLDADGWVAASKCPGYHPQWRGSPIRVNRCPRHRSVTEFGSTNTIPRGSYRAGHRLGGGSKINIFGDRFFKEFTLLPPPPPHFHVIYDDENIFIVKDNQFGDLICLLSKPKILHFATCLLIRYFIGMSTVR